jgi:hypothetical protein
VTGQHPDTERVYADLLQHGAAPPLPRDYGLRVVSAVLRAHDHIRLLETARQEKP